MNIAFLPHGMRREKNLASVQLEKLRFFEGDPCDDRTVADLGPDDHLICYPSSRILYRPHSRIRCKISVVLSEPLHGHKQFYRTFPFVWWRFHRVFTHSRRLLAKLPNGRFLPFGTTWVDVSLNHQDKTRHISLIASTRRELEGHAMRHRIADWARQTGQDVELLGHAYKPLDAKSDGLVPYRFSVVIENSREPGYFTEKLLDALFCDTVPIYWGDPDIGNFFDTRGMIVCETEDQIRSAVASLTAADYERYIAFMPANRRAALAHVDYEGNAAAIIRRELPSMKR